MNFAVDCDVKHQFKQTNKITTTILTMTLHPHHLQFALSCHLNLKVRVSREFSCVANYTEQKKKRNNYISLNFEQTRIQSEIIAFCTSVLDIRLPNARNRFSF